MTVANEGYQIALAGRQEMHRLNAVAAEGTVAALRGDVRARSGAHLVRAGRHRPGGDRRDRGAARQASAYAAMAEGDHALAFHELSLLFDADGAPTHYQLSWYVLADLAAFGRPVGRDRARPARSSRQALARLSGPLRPRMRLQVDRARALLAESDAGRGVLPQRGRRRRTCTSRSSSPRPGWTTASGSAAGGG